MNITLRLFTLKVFPQRLMYRFASQTLELDPPLQRTQYVSTKRQACDDHGGDYDDADDDNGNDNGNIDDEEDDDDDDSE